MEEAPDQPPATHPSAGIKIMVMLLASCGLVIAIDAIYVLFFVVKVSALASTTLIFAFTEKTAYDIYTLKQKSLRNFYIAAFLDAFYIGFVAIMAFLFPFHISSINITFFLTYFGLSLFIFLVLAIPFFFITRKKKGLFLDQSLPSSYTTT